MSETQTLLNEGLTDTEWSVKQALYAADNLRNLPDNRWVARVPATISEAEALLAQLEQEQMLPSEREDYFFHEESTSWGKFPPLASAIACRFDRCQHPLGSKTFDHGTYLSRREAKLGGQLFLTRRLRSCSLVV